MKNYQVLFGRAAALCLAFGSAATSAQTSAPSDTNSGSPAGEEVVKMSQFEVTTTQGHGYIANESATAFKTNEQLINVPQGDILVTADLINDLGYEEIDRYPAVFWQRGPGSGRIHQPAGKLRLQPSLY
jgi:hypothetical protein